jgi:hypothetical protein
MAKAQSTETINQLVAQGFGLPAATLCAMGRSAASQVHPLISSSAEETIDRCCSSLVAVESVLSHMAENDASIGEPEGARLVLESVRTALRFEQYSAEQPAE